MSPSCPDLVLGVFLFFGGVFFYFCFQSHSFRRKPGKCCWLKKAVIISLRNFSGGSAVNKLWDATAGECASFLCALEAALQFQRLRPGLLGHTSNPSAKEIEGHPQPSTQSVASLRCIPTLLLPWATRGWPCLKMEIGNCSGLIYRKLTLVC